MDRGARLFTPAQLGLSAVDCNVVATTTGLYVEVEQFESFLLVWEFSAGLPTAAISFGLQYTDGAALVDGSFAFMGVDGLVMPFVMQNPTMFAWGKYRPGSFIRVDDFSGRGASNPYPAKRIRFRIQITLAAIGTVSTRLFAQ